MTTQQIIKNASKYSSNFSLEKVESIRKTFVNPAKYAIVMGDNSQWWIVTNREASILAKNGYKI
ncbi:MAG: hypothetical protein ACKO96_28410, partial [Flammeovirgaceae bacterium]